MHSLCPRHLDNPYRDEQHWDPKNDRLAALAILALTVMPVNTPSVRVIVRLPWDRPEGAEPDPPHVRSTTFRFYLPVNFLR